VSLPASADDIPLSRPPPSSTASTFTSSADRPKTLYEIAAERRAALQPSDETLFSRSKGKGSAEFLKIAPDGSITPGTISTDHDHDEGEEGEGEPISPFFDTLFLALPLSVLHFTLAVLAAHQYAQELRFPPLARQTVLVALPTLFLLIHTAHGRIFPQQQRLPLSARTRHALGIFRQTVFLIVANVAGCYLIHVTNGRPYYAVMKKAPGIGTLWVWCVLEMGLLGAVAGVAGPGAFAAWKGYGIF